MRLPRENEPAPSSGESRSSAHSAVGSGVPVIDPKLVKNFREQIHALGALWLILGILAGILAALAFGGKPGLEDALGGQELGPALLLAGIALAWLIVGVLTCLKQLWAVYVGLVLNYLVRAAQVLNLNVCGVVIVVVVIARRIV